MSTTIGTTHRPTIDRNQPIKREDASLMVNTFWGGEKMGRQVQLTLDYTNKGYIHLTREQTVELIHLLIETLA